VIEKLFLLAMHMGAESHPWIRGQLSFMGSQFFLVQHSKPHSTTCQTVLKNYPVKIIIARGLCLRRWENFRMCDQLSIFYCQTYVCLTINLIIWSSKHKHKYRNGFLPLNLRSF